MSGKFLARLGAAAAIVLTAALFLSANARADTKLLNDGEIIALLNNATFQIQSRDTTDQRYHHFGPIEKTSQHGKLDVRNITAKEVEPGIWWVEEDQFCVLYEYVIKVRKRCFAIARDGNDLRFIETRYELPDKHIERPQEVMATAKLLEPGNAAGNYKLLTDQEIIALLNDATLYYTGIETGKPAIANFQPVEKPGEHGKMFVGSGRRLAAWWVEDEQFCMYFPLGVAIRKRCLAIARDGQDLRFIDTRWEQPGHRVQRPHTWAPTIQVYHTVG